MPATPEFIRWTLAHGCAIRTEFDRWEDPAWAYRQLIPLRAYSTAVREGRIYEGICVAPDVTSQTAAEDATAFRAEEVLEPYGGRVEVAAHCQGCPANVFYLATGDTDLSPQPETPLAGCFGLIDVSTLSPDLHARVDSVVRGSGTDLKWRQHFKYTQPAWYSFWITRAPSRPQLELVREVIHALLEDGDAFAPLKPLSAAIDTALQPQSDGSFIPLRVEAFTTGRVEGRKWYVDSHCSRCKAADKNRSIEQPCRVCGSTAQPIPPRTRCSAGKRPYWPLQSFLGEEQTVQWLERYLQR